MQVGISQPDATFLHVMAINFSFVVPKEVVEEYGADFGTHPVGTGAFKMTDWSLGQHVIFERNADYYDPDLPRLDRIEFQVGQEPSVALLRLQCGEVDILGDGTAQFLEVMGNDEWKGNVIEGGQLHTGYITLNRHFPANLQIHGNRIYIAPPRELHSLRSPPMTRLWRADHVRKAIWQRFPPSRHTSPVFSTLPSISSAYAGTGLRRRSSIKAKIFWNKIFDTATSASWNVT